MQHIDLPQPGSTRTAAELAYLTFFSRKRGPTGPLAYLHRVRSNVILAHDATYATGADAYTYYGALPGFLATVKEWARNKRFDLALCAPSQRHDHHAYLSAVRLVVPDLQDLTRFFAKAVGVRAGQLNSIDALLPGVTCTLQTDCSRHDSALIVDDVFNNGLTAGALLYRLRERGLSQGAAITVLAPVWIEPK